VFVSLKISLLSVLSISLSKCKMVFLKIQENSTKELKLLPIIFPNKDIEQSDCLMRIYFYLLFKNIRSFKKILIQKFRKSKTELKIKEINFNDLIKKYILEN